MNSLPLIFVGTKTKNMTPLTKAEKKIRKAVYAIHLGVNTLNEFGMYDYQRARNRAKSVHYWSSKK